MCVTPLCVIFPNHSGILVNDENNLLGIFWHTVLAEHSSPFQLICCVYLNTKINKIDFWHVLVFDSIWQFKSFFTVYDRFLTGVMSKTHFDCQNPNSGFQCNVSIRLCFSSTKRDEELASLLTGNSRKWSHNVTNIDFAI